MAKRYEWQTFYDTDVKKNGGLAASGKALAEKAESEGWEVFQFLAVTESVLGVICRKAKVNK